MEVIVSAPAARNGGASAPPVFVSATARRWLIWLRQVETAGEPCFATERRYTCAKRGCEYRDECMSMRAEWQR